MTAFGGSQIPNPAQATYARIRPLLPWLAGATVVLCVLGFDFGLPASGNVHGLDAHRILYLHVPATWMSVFVFAVMTFAAAFAAATGSRLAQMVEHALAPTGATFAFLAVWTGSLWGKPLWGVWWVWDSRLLTEVALLLTFSAAIVLHTALQDNARAARVISIGLVVFAAILSGPLTMLFNWPVLHRNPPVVLGSALSFPPRMLTGLVLVTLGFATYSAAMTLTRLRCIILERERQSEWVARCGKEVA